MKNWYWCFVILLAAACNSNRDYKPESHLSIEEMDKVMTAVIRYLGKPPENVNETEKFDSKYDRHYQELASRHRVDKYFIDGKGYHYFLISRPAPSLFDKRVATGGMMKFSDDWKLTEYEEIFRTWKMKEDNLKEKGLILFDGMVKHESLLPYQAPVATEEYIEFPDTRTYYDKASRSWRTR